MKTIQKKLFLQDIILSIIIVTKNDGDIVEEVLHEIKDQLKKIEVSNEIVIVDNDSTDQTVDKIRKLQKAIPYTRTLRLSKGYEKEIAITAGLDNCIGDYAIVFNIYTDPPEIIPQMIAKLLNQYDIVIGEETSCAIVHDFLSRAFLSIVQKISTHQFIYTQNYLLGLNRKAINSIIQTRRKSRNLNYINYLIGFKKAVISYKSPKKYLFKIQRENFFKIIFNVTNIIISNSFKPMRILSILGMFASVAFLLYVFFIALLKVLFNIYLAPEGWITLGAVLGTMFLILFSFLAIMGEYIIRVLDETRNEPFYFIADEIDKSMILPKKNQLNVS